MADELKDQRIPIMMSPSEVKAIDDWMFANRIKSRAEAIRRLCQLGLVIDDKGPFIFDAYNTLTQKFHAFIKFINSKNIKESNNEAKLNSANELLEHFFTFMFGVAEPIDDLRRSTVTFGSDKVDISALLKFDRNELYNVFKDMRDKISQDIDMKGKIKDIDASNI